LSHDHTAGIDELRHFMHMAEFPTHELRSTPDKAI